MINEAVPLSFVFFLFSIFNDCKKKFFWKQQHTLDFILIILSVEKGHYAQIMYLSEIFLNLKILHYESLVLRISSLI